MAINLLSPTLLEELKKMSLRELELLAYEIREFLIDNVSKTGGHFASNLGVVELTIALHRVFSTPQDKIVWDVGHQSYVHKILTGRASEFYTLRQLNGLSGFPKRNESIHDCFDTGHSSNSISAAFGMAISRDILGKKDNVVAVIGDGALTGGMAYEALNNAGASNKDFIVILNDNGMSISKNIGGMSHHLNRLRTSNKYIELKKTLKHKIRGIPNIGEGLYTRMDNLKDLLKYSLIDGAIFEEIGFTYLGPIDGHNLEELIEALNLAKRGSGPILVHVITKKGKGYINAEKNPGKFHGIGPFDKESGATKVSKEKQFSTSFGEILENLADENDNVVAICAAMESGTGLTNFASKYPERFFDVGIAEEHAVSFAAGLATQGIIPVVAIYSTFLQRAYDQIIIDVCMQNLPVIFALDRAGIVGNDGETHHGIFDISYLKHMPNMTLLSPMDEKELDEMMHFVVKYGKPVSIRYPRGTSENIEIKNRQAFSGKSQVLIEGKEAEIWAVGKMTRLALKVSENLAKYGFNVGVVNAAIVSPIDEDTLLKSFKRTRKIITIEDNVIAGGFGETINTIALQCEDIKVLNLGWPSKFIEHGDTELLFKKYNLDEQSITERIKDFIER